MNYRISLTPMTKHRSRFTTLYSHTIGTADRQTELIVYDHSNNCQCDRTLCTTTPPFERLNNNQNQ